MVKITKKENKTKIFLLVGEDSGDFIASKIIKGFPKSFLKDIEFYGVCGNRMKNLNVNETFHFNKINILGFKDILINYFKMKKIQNYLVTYILNLKPDIIVTIDAKLFSIKLGKALKNIFFIKNIDIPLIHIVLPTIWAHSPNRAKKWKNIHNKLISIIPSEKEYFNKFSIPTLYFGNPFFENLIYKKKIYHKNKNNFCLLLPGSREKEINYNLKPMLESVLLINKKYSEINWLLPTLDQHKEKISLFLKHYKLHEKVKIINFEKNFSQLLNSKIAIACSGTVTLELALAGIPTIGIYKTDLLSAFIGKRLVNFNNVILPNFIIGKQLIPFLFQNKCNPTEICRLFYDFYEKNNEYKKKFKKYSKLLIDKMGYQKNRRENDFGKKIAKEIIKLIS